MSLDTPGQERTVYHGVLVCMSPRQSLLTTVWVAECERNLVLSASYAT